MLDYKKLLDLTIEAEGLIRVVIDNPSAEASNLLDRKLRAIAEAYQCSAPEPQLPAPEPEVIIQPELPAPEPEVIIQPELPAPEPEADPEPELPGADTAIPEMRLDQVLTQRTAMDLSRAFTINDRFRFARELFDGDREALDNTINRIDACESLGEAYDIMLNDLEWDPEELSVKDFITIISNHFNSIS